MCKMAEEERDDGEGFFEEFKKDLSLVDEFASLVLRGHYVLERELDKIIEKIFFHPERILTDRVGFGFERKVRLVRAMSRNASEHPHWDIVLALNSLRNTIAHHGYNDRLERVERIRQACLICTKLDQHEREHGGGYTEVVLFAFGMGVGFLGYIEDDLASLRGEIEELIAQHGASD